MSLADVPSAELLAELDRRARAAQPPAVHFFGVWPGNHAGHFRRDSRGRMVKFEDSLGRFPAREAGLYPWSDWTKPQPQGKIWHWYDLVGEPLTLLLSWDRSADERGGCCATFIVHAHVTPEHGLALAREVFPAVFDRIETHLGRPVELAGSVDDAVNDRALGR